MDFASRAVMSANAEPAPKGNETDKDDASILNAAPSSPGRTCHLAQREFRLKNYFLATSIYLFVSVLPFPLRAQALPTPIVIPSIIPSLSPSENFEVHTSIPSVYLQAVKEPPIPITPQAQVWLEAAPTQAERVSWLRQKAAGVLEQIHYHLFVVSIEGVNAILSWEGNSSAAEDEMREARALFTEYLDILKQIELLTGDKLAEETYRKRMANIRIIPNKTYEVETHDSTFTQRFYPVSPVQSASTVQETSKPQTTHTEYSYPIVKVPISAGFDAKGNPTYKMGLDVVRTAKEVPDK